jgi:hypothetical protein
MFSFTDIDLYNSLCRDVPYFDRLNEQECLMECVILSRYVSQHVIMRYNSDIKIRYRMFHLYPNDY